MVPSIETALRVRFSVVERTKRPGRVATWWFNFKDLGPGASQELTAELAFLIGKFEDFHIEKKSSHKHSDD
jgi:hypothetical protein